MRVQVPCTRYLFFFNDTATTEIYPLSLHDALPISETVAVCDRRLNFRAVWRLGRGQLHARGADLPAQDRKSTRLNSSHMSISYAVFCLKKKIVRAVPAAVYAARLGVVPRRRPLVVH